MTLCYTHSFSDTDMYIINPGLGDKLLCKNIDNKINSTSEEFQQNELATWSKCNKKDSELGFRLKIAHPKVSQCFEVIDKKRIYLNLVLNFS